MSSNLINTSSGKQSFMPTRRSLGISVSCLLRHVEDAISKEEKQKALNDLCRRVSLCKVFYENGPVSGIMSDMLLQQGIYIRSNIDFVKQYSVMVNRQTLIGIGVRNIEGGLEFYSNKLNRIVTIGNIGATVIRSDRQNRDECLLFFNFLDYLAYLTVLDRLKDVTYNVCDVVIINNYSNIHSVLELCMSYKSINSFLPSDSSSETIYNTILHLFSGKLTDCSWFYRNKGFDSFSSFCSAKFGNLA